MQHGCVSFPSDANAVFDFVDFAANREATQAHPYVRNHKDTEEVGAIGGHRNSSFDFVVCPRIIFDCSGLLCVSVSLCLCGSCCTSHESLAREKNTISSMEF